MTNYYWVGGGTNTNWNSSPVTNWALTSGGIGGAVGPPATGDAAIFDGNSGTGTSNQSASITIGSLDMSAYGGTWTRAGSTTLTVDTGDLVMGSGVTFSASASNVATAFTGSGTQNFTSAGKTFGGITVNGTGSLVLQDALTTRSDAGLTLTQGTFNGNGYAVTVAGLSGSNSNTRALTLGNGLWTLRGIAAAAGGWNLSTTTNLTFTKGTSNIVVNGANGSTGTFSFNGGGLTYNDLTLNASNGSSLMTFSFDANDTFGTITINGQNAVRATAGRTVTATSLVTSATASTPILFYNSSTSRLNFSIASGTINFSYCAFHLFQGSGGATFSATNSYDIGGNTGITITPPPTAALAARIVGGFHG